MLKEYNKNGEFVKMASFKDLLQENYFVSKSINIIYKKKPATGFNLKESNNYYFEFIVTSKFNDDYAISPMLFFKLDLIDTSKNLEKIGSKIRDSLEFKDLVKYNQELREKKTTETLENLLAMKYLKNEIIVNFKK
jgi:hypothetical protein